MREQCILSRDRMMCFSAFVLLALAAGCSQNRTVLEAFPTGQASSPWLLHGALWSGTFEQATAGMGAEADAWRKFSPKSAWLAVYRHELRATQKLTVRILEFSDVQEAHAAYDANAPLPRRRFEAGDEGCWTEDGVLFRWGLLTIEVFSSNSAGQPVAEQAVYLVGFLEKKMPPGLPHHPR